MEWGLVGGPLENIGGWPAPQPPIDGAPDAGGLWNYAEQFGISVFALH